MNEQIKVNPISLYRFDYMSDFPKTTEMVGCCAGALLYQFGHYNKCPNNTHEPSFDTLLKQTERLVEFQRNTMKRVFMACTLTFPQADGVPGDVVRKLGFKPSRLGVNKHGDTLYFYKLILRDE